jgi:hypothetical protein
VIPADPAHPEYRQGNTLGPNYRHWLRAKFFGRFRLFCRYDSRSQLIVYAWVNAERSLRQRSARSDPYEVFRRMLESGNPPTIGRRWCSRPASSLTMRFLPWRQPRRRTRTAADVFSASPATRRGIATAAPGIAAMSGLAPSDPRG